MSEQVARILTKLEAAHGGPPHSKSGPKPKIKVTGLIVEPWIPAPTSPTVEQAILRCEERKWTVTSNWGTGFRAFYLVGRRPIQDVQVYDFQLMDGVLCSRRHHHRDPSPGEHGWFLCEGCWSWKREGTLVMVNVGCALWSVHRHSVCQECIDDGILQRTVNAGYVASIEKEPV